MILFISDIGASLPIVYRMRQEGVNTKIFINKDQYKSCYEGLVDKVSLEDLRREIRIAEKVIFDSDVNLEALGDCMEDKSICQSFKVEDSEIMKIIGMKESKDNSGIKLIVEMWFNGESPTHYTYCLPGQKWLTGNLGIEMSSQTNCLWIAGKPGVFTEKIDELIPLLTTNSYIGPVSLEIIIGRDKKQYFNGFHIGFKYDSIFCLLELLGESFMSLFIKDGILTNNGFACSERVTVPPYPYTNKALLDGLAKGVKLDVDLGNGFWCQDIKDTEDGLRCVGNDGLLGVMTGTGPKVADGFGKIYKAIRKLNTDANLQFRIDGTRETNKKLKKLNELNLN